jgi:hypothetical protein
LIDFICISPDFELDVEQLHVELDDYDSIRYWNCLAELTYQVLLVNVVINIGSSEREIARYPYEVRKAWGVAGMIDAQRQPIMTAPVVHLSAG